MKAMVRDSRALLIFLCAMSLVFATFLWSRGLLTSSFEQKLDADTSVRARLIQEKLELSLLLARAAGRFAEVSGGTPGAALDRFTLPFLREFRGLRSIRWIGAGQVELGPTGGGGFGAGFLDDWRTALEAAARTGEPSATGPIRLSGGGDAPGLGLCVPVIPRGEADSGEGERDGPPAAYVLATFDANDLVEHALSPTTPLGLPFDLLDVTAPGDGTVLYHWDARLVSPAGWWAFLHPDDRESFQAFPFADRRWALRVTPNSAYLMNHWSLQPWIVLAAGTIMALLLTFSLMAILLKRDSLRAMNLALQREIGDALVAREALNRAREDLERKCEELHKLDLLKDGLLRDVSHELKTPVAKHAVEIELLRASLGESCRGKVGEIIRVMEASVRRQKQVIRNMLDLARFKGGARRYAVIPVRIDEVLRGAIEECRPGAESAACSFETSLQPLTVNGDEATLGHVFSNLLENAVRYRAKDRPCRVSIDIGRENRQAIVRIRDNGIGMEPAELSRAFEQFYRASASDEGSGVGLSICREIVEGMGGSIVLESEGRDRGLTAVVRLPLA